jgi:hypothetical protein
MRALRVLALLHDLRCLLANEQFFENVLCPVANEKVFGVLAKTIKFVRKKKF